MWVWYSCAITIITGVTAVAYAAAGLAVAHVIGVLTNVAVDTTTVLVVTGTAGIAKVIAVPAIVSVATTLAQQDSAWQIKQTTTEQQQQQQQPK